MGILFFKERDAPSILGGNLSFATAQGLGLAPQCLPTPRAESRRRIVDVKSSIQPRKSSILSGKVQFNSIVNQSSIGAQRIGRVTCLLFQRNSEEHLTQQPRFQEFEPSTGSGWQSLSRDSTRKLAVSEIEPKTSRWLAYQLSIFQTKPAVEQRSLWGNLSEKKTRCHLRHASA